MIVEVYTKTNCTFCTKAKALLRNRRIPFTELILGEDFTREILLGKFPSVKTYPVVVIDGFHIGGASELQQYLSENAELNDTRKVLFEANWNGN